VIVAVPVVVLHVVLLNHDSAGIYGSIPLSPPAGPTGPLQAANASKTNMHASFIPFFQFVPVVFFIITSFNVPGL
jgi:hypothetical protein